MARSAITILLLSTLLAACATTPREEPAATASPTGKATPAIAAGRMQKLPSGKEINIIDIAGMNFQNGQTALVLKYRTDIPAENSKKLKAEAEEIWKSFRYDVEQKQSSVGIIQAFKIGSNDEESIGFVYERDDSGKWHITEKNNSQE